MAVRDLQELYGLLNTHYFDNLLPFCQVTWSRQLTRTAGNIDVRRRRMKLSVPLLIDAYRRTSNGAPQYDVCGVTCSTAEDALCEIMKHEMIHLWLHVQGLPSGHTAAFRAKARALGQSKIRHAIAVPEPSSGWMYACSFCGYEFPRRRRYGRPVACSRCCARYNKGKYDARFKLQGRKIG